MAANVTVVASPVRLLPLFYFYLFSDCNITEIRIITQINTNTMKME